MTILTTERLRLEYGFSWWSFVERASGEIVGAGCIQLYAVCHPDNAASASVMKRLAMRYRGIEIWYEMPLAAYEISSAEWQRRGAGS
jgi:RimJ/RimL family protein N-acetyltransferase